jgi:7-carboxy-7-deazaguanine synthase
MLKINEIYHSIQGESTSAGRPCVFVRLTHCNLRCTYCDTEYAFYDGNDISIQHVIDEVEKYNCKLVEVTGGEPLVQMDECLELMKRLCDLGYEVMIETGGSLPIKDIDHRVKIIMKFVIGNREDYDWTFDVLKKYKLNGKCEMLFSVVFGKLEPVELVNWILEDKVDVRFQLQMHKYIWHPETKGV